MSNEPLRQAARRGPTCPDLYVLFGSNGNPRAPELESHIAACAACQTELSLHDEFMSPHLRPGEQMAVNYILSSIKLPVDESLQRSRVPWWKPFTEPFWLGSAAVACAVVIFAVGISSQRSFHRTDPAPVSGEREPERSQSLSITSPTGELAGVPQQVTWKPVAGAARYSITLSEVDRNPLFYTTVTTCLLLFPKSVVTLITPGKTVFLEVSALDDKGNVIATSGRRSVRVGLIHH